MFFRKKKADPTPAPRDASAPPPTQGSGDPAASTVFLTGDSGLDQRMLDRLLGAIAKVSEARELETLLQNIVDTSVEITQSERGFLILVGPEGELDVRVSRQRGHQDVKGEVRFSTSIVKRVLADREPIRATVSSDSEALELGTSVFDLKLRAVMCVPLIADAAGGPVERGVLYVDSKVATREFTPRDLALFHKLSLFIRIALQNNKLHLAALEKLRLERSLDIASQIQRDLMPAIPKDVPGFDVFGWYRPAEHTTGDFLETLTLKNGRLALALGDVTGKGIGPALIMENAKGALRTYLRLVDDPARIMTQLNNDLAARMDAGRFLTLFLAVFESDGRVRAVNAGHTPPLVWRAKTQTLETIDGNGPALGMSDDYEYEGREPHVLQSGDVLIAYTDGFDEARSTGEQGALFGEEGVREALLQAAQGGAGAKEIVERIVRAVLEWTGGKQYDDMALVVVRRTQA